jgi:hypothetical protein
MERVSPHAGGGNFLVAWQLSVCFKPQLNHGKPPYEFGPVSQPFPHICYELWFLRVHKAARGSCRLQIFWSRMVSIFAVIESVRPIPYINDILITKGKMFNEHLTMLKKLSYEWVIPDSKSMQRRANSSARQ